MQPWYNSRKAAQIAAFFAMREGGNIPALKVVKLIYLAERSFMDAYEASMLNDQLVSMEHGPVNSITLNRINGSGDDGREWAEFVTDREFHRISVANKVMTEEALDELSRAELKVLGSTWDKFGHMDQWEIRNYTHDHCPEWEDPDFSSHPIPYSRVFKFLGKENPEELDKRIQRERTIDALLNS
ncbi:Panacea domain-containing protein [Aminobacter sp. BA135]|uniref:Panacea domain-containing protein n=1 Tax=Aminobacter sp. BA135 TaxID=537596 RepID=UPI003D7BCDC2